MESVGMPCDLGQPTATALELPTEWRTDRPFRSGVPSKTLPAKTCPPKPAFQDLGDKLLAAVARPESLLGALVVVSLSALLRRNESSQ